MKKADIRAAVLAALCDLGYPQGNWGWGKPGRLVVMFRTREIHTLRIPASSKTTKARLQEILDGLPRYGAARPMPQSAKADEGFRQADIEDYLVGDAR